jgi:hypothetical protein
MTHELSGYKGEEARVNGARYGYAGKGASHYTQLWQCGRIEGAADYFTENSFNHRKFYVFGGWTSTLGCEVGCCKMSSF